MEDNVMKKGYWETKDGEVLSMKNMTTSHLNNSINLLIRYSKHIHGESIKMGIWMSGFLQGEMALDDVENGLIQLSEEGPDIPEKVYELNEELKKRGKEINLNKLLEEHW